MVHKSTLPWKASLKVDTSLCLRLLGYCLLPLSRETRLGLEGHVIGDQELDHRVWCKHFKISPSVIFLSPKEGLGELTRLLQSMVSLASNTSQYQSWFQLSPCQHRKHSCEEVALVIADLSISHVLPSSIISSQNSSS